MRKLILIKHAQPQVADGVPSHEWALSEAGRQKCQVLAERIREHGPDRIVTSEEPKAMETGKIVAEILGRPCETASGLGEHDRSDVPMMRPADFISWMALFFKKREELVLGHESAEEAYRRFASAVEDVLDQHGEGNVAIVTHGTVLALFVAAQAEMDPYQLWRKMGLPSFAVLELPEMKVLGIVEKVE